MIAKYMFRTAMLLSVFAVVATGILAATNFATRDTIAENERKATLRAINALVPTTLRDNDMVADSINIIAESALGSEKPLAAYRGRRVGEPVALVMETVAPDGYSGDIKLLVAIAADGTLAGVRVINHRETPGLGDFIEAEKSNWILNFQGLSLSNPARNGWRVKKDGGVFDQFTGATITPRAVVKAVHNALQYFSANREQLFELASGTTLKSEDEPKS